MMFSKTQVRAACEEHNRKDVHWNVWGEGAIRTDQSEKKRMQGQLSEDGEGTI
jgi:hypothetical protein